MKPSLITRLDQLSERYLEVQALLSDAETISQQSKFRELSREYSQLEPLSLCYQRYQSCLGAIESAELLSQDQDAEMRAMAQEELSSAKLLKEELEKELQILLLPPDPDDNSNVFIEIRAAAGGDESAIFAGDLYRMYSKYAESNRWSVEVIHESAGDHGGYKEIIIRIIGSNVYSNLKFESGAHRVQRVPETEAQGRIHTSTCTVAIMPEIAEVDEIKINPADLKVDTYRASGAGGQHVNKTDSAIRITHIPTGTVVECQDERSQHKNRARAMSLLQSRLLAAEKARHQAEQAATRRSLVGTGDRSERIRTYNYPQTRVTDHRINLTLYKLPAIMEGDMSPIIQALRSEHQADMLAALSE